MFSCSFISVITHVTVINNYINDDKGAPGPLTNEQGAPIYQLGGPGIPNRQPGGPNWQLGGPGAPN